MYVKTSDQPKLEMGFGDYVCNWGLHIAGLYETAEERDEIIMGYMHRGDVDGDLQLYCPASGEDAFRETYSERYPACAGHLDDPDKFQLMPTHDLYYPDGVFSPWAMTEGLNAFYADSQKDGHRNVRASAEMIWALKAIPGSEHLMAYESRLNYFIPGKPWVSVCLYDLNAFSGSTIMGVLRTHPYTISGGVITENPYYQDPDDWLCQHAPQFLPPDKEREAPCDTDDA